LTAAAPLVAGGPPRLVRRLDAAPVAWRATPDAVYVVGTAASPVGRDDVRIDVSVESGAVLTLRSAAATVAWRGAGTSHHITAAVADSATLDWHPQPLIATAGCRHRQRARVRLQGRGRVRWAEEVLLGRHGEQPGGLDLRLDVDLDGIALLRHQLTLGPGEPAWDGPAVIGRWRCLGLVLDAGRGTQPCTPATYTDPSASCAVLDLEGPGRLVLAVADDLPALHRALDAVQQEH
jgi:urease accessory protein